MKLAVDPQTEADLQSQKLIIGSLAKAFPSLKIVGEEGDLKIEESDIIKVDTARLDSYASSFKNLPYSPVLAEDVTVWIGMPLSNCIGGPVLARVLIRSA